MRADCDLVALVDPQHDRARALAQRFGVPRIFASHRSLLDEDVDGALVAVPNHLHAAVSAELLHGGIDVLVEKPMARSVEEGRAMLSAAETGDAVLAVGLPLRFSQANRLVKSAIDSDFLGEIESFSFRSGVAFDWPVTSTYLLDRDTAGGGALIDVGTHVLDLLLWWLGDVSHFEYFDDSCGGVEAECRLDAVTESGVSGTVELSRTRELGQTAVITGDQTELAVVLVENRLRLRLRGGRTVISGQAAVDGASAAPQSVDDLFEAEHSDFIAAVARRSAPAVAGDEALRSLALVEDCYRQRRPLRLPWTIS